MSQGSRLGEALTDEASRRDLMAKTKLLSGGRYLLCRSWSVWRRTFWKLSSQLASYARFATSFYLCKLGSNIPQIVWEREVKYGHHFSNISQLAVSIVDRLIGFSDVTQSLASILTVFPLNAMLAKVNGCIVSECGHVIISKSCPWVWHSLLQLYPIIWKFRCIKKCGAPMFATILVTLLLLLWYFLPRIRSVRKLPCPDHCSMS